jgi:hypothetical protein
MSSTDFDLLIRDAHQVQNWAKSAKDLRGMADAVERLARVVEELATALKESEQARERSRRS